MRFIKNNVYIARRERGLKQKDVAKALLINKQTYHLKETGKSEFTIREGKRLARFYNCTLNDLFEDDIHVSTQSDSNSDRILKDLTHHLDEILKLMKLSL